MIRRPSLIAAFTLSAALGGAGCTGDCPPPEDIGGPVELGVSEDLHAIAQAGLWLDSREYSFVAAGDAGTIVTWGVEYLSTDTVFVERFDVGDADLRGIWTDNGGDDWSEVESWWVVGDAGTVAMSDDGGATWDVTTLADGSANLRDIVGARPDRPVAVGDEAVFVRRADGSWAEAPVPAGGWGELRAIATDGSRFVAVGLGGVAWSTVDPLAAWIPVELGVEVDLFDVEFSAPGAWGQFVIVGAEGTMLLLDGFEAEPVATGVSVDLIDFDARNVLGGGGELFEFNGDSLAEFDRVSGARALSHDWLWDPATVGDGGAAIQPPVFQFGC